MINLPRLRTVLNASGLQSSNNALYQVINELLGYLTAVAEGKHLQGPPGPQGLPGPSPQLDQTFITHDDEPTLTNSRVLVAGSNITLDKTVDDTQLIINSLGGGSGSGGMEYLGDYVSGPTYNDGDIVIATDGIAYVCTKNGTTTPPEPWPGISVAVNATVDATYWVVNPHASLVNERVMSVLGNGYVKSTNGEPSVVATIPLTDTSGTLPDARLSSNVALKNINNNFVAQTFAAFSTVSGANSAFYFEDTSSPVDSKIWRFIASGGGNTLQALNDAGTVSQASYAFGRDGILTAAAFAGDGSRLTGIIPPGTIVIRVDACPPGWTRVAWDGQFLRVGAAFGVSGGSNPTTHAHGVGTLAYPAHSHSAGSLAVDAHAHGTVSVSGSTNNTGAHTHTWSDSINQSTGGESSGVLTVDGGSSGTVTRGTHTHNMSFTVSGTTSNDGNHTHTFSGSGGTSNASPGVSGNTGTTGSGGAITGSTQAVSHLPPYYDVILCQKN